LKEWAAYVLNEQNLQCYKCEDNLEKFNIPIPDCQQCPFYHLQQEFEPNNYEAWRVFNLLRQTTGFSEGLDYTAMQFLFETYGIRKREETFDKIIVCMNEDLRIKNQSSKKFEMTNKIKRR
jgi:hypothetical protein